MKPGLETLLGRHASWLRGCRVGLLSHQAAVNQNGATTAERLRDALGDRLVALFGPEHGYFGLAGAGVRTVSRPHPEWGIPVHSLYGEHRRPSREMLAGLDVVVVDFQDLGARCYTYLATLRRMLEAAGEAGVGVIVADRPVPLPGTVDGPPLDPAFRSFVADAAVPLAYGMTPGEAARWLRLHDGIDVDLRVAPCAGWRRPVARLPDAPEWIPPSPAIRTWESAQAYLATVFTEAVPSLDCGRATNLAFRVLGAPWLDAPALCTAFAREDLPGVALHPFRYTAGAGPFDGQELAGVRISVTHPAAYRPVATSTALLDLVVRKHGAQAVWGCPGFRPDFFDKLYGSDRTRLALAAGTPWREVVAGWEPSLAAYRETRAAALLYVDSRR